MRIDSKFIKDLFKSHREFLVLLLVFIILYFVLFYPHSRELTTTIAQQGDSNFVAWVIDTGLEKVSNLDFRNFGESQMGYPYPNTYFFSDHSFGLTIQSIPLLLVDRTPAIIVSWNIILSLSLSFFGMFYFLRTYKLSKVSSLFPAIVYTFSVYHIGLMGHIQIFSYQYIILTLLWLKLYIGNPKSKYILLAALSFVLNGLISIYLLIFGSIVIGVFLGIYIKEFLKILKDRSNLVPSFFALVFTVLIIAVFYVPYLGISNDHNVVRNIEEVSTDRTSWKDLFSPGGGHLFLKPQTASEGLASDEHRLYFGFITIAICILALALLVKKRREIKNETKKLVILSLLLITVGFTLSMGPFFYIGENVVSKIYLPYYLLYHHVFIFKGLRAPARFNIITFIGIVILFGLGVYFLEKYSKKYLSQKHFSNLSKKIISACLILLFFVIIAVDVLPLKNVGKSKPAYLDRSDLQWINTNIPRDKILAYDPPYAFVEQLNNYFHIPNKTINLYSGIFPQGVEAYLSYIISIDNLSSEDVDNFFGILSTIGVDYFIHARSWSINQTYRKTYDNFYKILEDNDNITYQSDSLIIIDLDDYYSEDFIVSEYDYSIVKDDGDNVRVVFQNNSEIPQTLGQLGKVRFKFNGSEKHHHEFFAPLFLKPGSEYSYNLDVSSEDLSVEYISL